MDDRTVIEWDKDDLDALELLKVDVLGLGMLSCLRRGFDLLRIHYGLTLTLPAIVQAGTRMTIVPIYGMIARADTIGVFQIESRAQMSMLPRLRPKEFYDLVIEVAIVRPGPIQGDMVHPYLRRREGREPVTYPSKATGRAFSRRRSAFRCSRNRRCASPWSAPDLRLKKPTGCAVPWRRSSASAPSASFEEKFIAGMISRGYDPEFAAACWKQIEGFGSYGFPESHAASFANLVYASAWIKCRYPDVFAAALLNSQPMGFYAPAQIVRDAQEHGVEVRPVDVNLSDWDCKLEKGPKPSGRLHPRHASMRDDIRTTHALRLGFRQISGFSEDDGKIIESVRGAGFDSVRDLWLRTRLKPAALERLAEADAFRSLGLDRREALWAVRALQRAGDKDDLPLFARVAMPELEPDADLPPMLPGEHVVEDYRHLHLSLKAHPVSFLRADLHARGILPP